MQKIRLTQKLRNAATLYIDLNSRKIHPRGLSDSVGRWMPSQELKCCKSIRTPSRSWPWSLLLHCRTLVHVAKDTGYELEILRAAVRRVEEETS